MESHNNAISAPTPAPLFDFAAARQHPYHHALLRYVATFTHTTSDEFTSALCYTSLRVTLRARSLDFQVPGGSPSCSAADTICHALRQILDGVISPQSQSVVSNALSGLLPEESIESSGANTDREWISPANNGIARNTTAVNANNHDISESTALRALLLVERLVRDVPRFFVAVSSRALWPAIRHLALRNSSNLGSSVTPAAKATTLRARMLVRAWAASLTLQAASWSPNDPARAVARFLVEQAAELRRRIPAQSQLPVPSRPWVHELQYTTRPQPDAIVDAEDSSISSWWGLHWLRRRRRRGREEQSVHRPYREYEAPERWDRGWEPVPGCLLGKRAAVLEESLAEELAAVVTQPRLDSTHAGTLAEVLRSMLEAGRTATQESFAACVTTRTVALDAMNAVQWLPPRTLELVDDDGNGGTSGLLDAINAVGDLRVLVDDYTQRVGIGALQFTIEDQARNRLVAAGFSRAENEGLLYSNSAQVMGWQGAVGIPRAIVLPFFI